MREVHFEGVIGPSFVEASDERVKKLVQEFLQVKDTPGSRGALKRAAGEAEGQAPAADGR